MTPYDRFRVALTDSKIDTREAFALAGMVNEVTKARTNEVATGSILSEQQVARIAHILGTADV